MKTITLTLDREHTDSVIGDRHDVIVECVPYEGFLRGRTCVWSGFGDSTKITTA